MRVSQLLTPVALILFNRPDTTARVFARIREQQPKQLFLIADGPRADRLGEAALCEEARRLVLDNIDWPCDVIQDFSEVNLGCENRVASGLTHLFEVHEEAIILEDDCLPHPTFFRYCQELLEKYRDTPSVMHIGGYRVKGLPKSQKTSYQIGTWPQVWGWASWRRAWNGYDVAMPQWPENKEELRCLFLSCLGKETTLSSTFWLRVAEIFNAVQTGQVNTWDTQWLYHLVKSQGKTITPALNLIENIGFDERATHTDLKGWSLPHWFESEVFPIQFPLRHPANSEIDDAFNGALNHLLHIGSFPKKVGLAARVIRKIKRTFS